MDIKKLSEMANVLRRDVLQMTTSAGGGHPSSCLSCAEIISALFFDVMKYDVKNANNEDNDEFILSKGHAAPILYAALYRSGALKGNLMKLRKLDGPLEGHPMPSKKNSVDKSRDRLAWAGLVYWCRDGACGEIAGKRF